MLSNSISPSFCQIHKAPILNIVYNVDITQLQEISTTPISPSSCGLAFNTDGTKLYISYYNEHRVEQYSLSIPWDPTSMSSDSKGFNLDTGEADFAGYTALYGITFNPTGTKIFCTGYGTVTRLLSFSLTTPWDISTVVYDGLYFNYPDRYYMRTVFSQDGLRMYAPHRSGTANILEHVLSTPWDISTAVLNHTFDISALDSKFQTMCTNSIGTKFYVIGTGGSFKIFELSLAVPWDLSSAVYENIFYYNANISTYSAIDISSTNTDFYFINSFLNLKHLTIQ